MTKQIVNGIVGNRNFHIENENKYYTFPLILKQNPHLCLFEIDLILNHTKTYDFMTEINSTTYQCGVRISSVNDEEPKK